MVIQRSVQPRTKASQDWPQRLNSTKRKMKMNIARSLTNWRKYRQTVTELGRMTDRELSDLGIGRQDIRRVAKTAVGF